MSSPIGKKLSALVVLLALALLAAPLVGAPFQQVNAASTFEIDENGTLTKYNGTAANVTIPSTVKTIGTSAFYENTHLVSVDIPSSVTAVGVSAFYGCTSLQSAYMTASIKTIGAGAFARCEKLSTLTMANGVTSIGNEAFRGCEALTYVKLSTSLKTIGKEAFYRSGLTSLTLPSSVKTLGDRCFAQTKVTGVLLAGTFTTIPVDAFEDCTSLKQLIIPGHVTKIDNYAFAGCTSLTNVTMADSVTDIGEHVFEKCTSLKTVKLSANLKEIGDYMFTDCPAIESITVPDSCTSIGSSAFRRCTSLQSINFPSSIKMLGYYTFDGCTALQSADLSKTSITAIYKDGFKGCTALTTVKLPPSGNKVSVWEGAFEDCVKLGSLSPTSQINSLGNRAFKNCASLLSIDLSNSGCVIVHEETFSGCTALETVRLKSNAYEIGDAAFKDCSALTFLNMTTNMRRIGKSAFYGCSKLASTMTLPSYIEEIQPYTFYNCASLTTINLPSSVKSIGAYAFYGCKSWTGSVTVPDGATQIAPYTFYKCSSLTGITIPSTVTSVSAYAFYECQKMAITLPDGLTTVGINAFYNCLQLKSANLSKLTTAGAYAFHNCQNLKTVGKCSALSSVPVGMFRNCTSLESISLPKVSSIGNYAFYNCRALSSVTVSGAPTSVGTYAFYCCTSLKGLSLPSSVTSIGDYAFYGCSAMTYIYLPSKLTSVGKDAFRNCVALTSFNASSTQLADIGNEALRGCTKLVTVRLPNTLKTVGEYAFAECGAINSMSLPSYITSIGQYAFRMDTSITSLTIPFSCPVVPKGMCYGCTSLKTVNFGNTTTDVGDYAFYGCTSLTNWQNIGNLYGVGKSSFENCKGIKTITFPISAEGFEEKAFAGCTSLTSVFFNRQSVSFGKNVFQNAGALRDVYYVGTQSLWNEKVSGQSLFTSDPNLYFQYTASSPNDLVTSSVVIKNLPAKRTYTVGESFASAGMRLKVTFTDASYAEITRGFTYSPLRMDKLGSQKVVVTYGGKSTGFYVTVNPAGKTVSNMVIKTLPTKRAYAVGEAFDPKGMTLKITYSDGTTAIVSDGYSYTPIGKLTAAGQQKIVVSYAGRSTRFYVTVTEAGKLVTGMTIKTLPTKKTYTAGETFDPSGMTLNVTYADKHTAVVSTGYTCTPNGKLTTAGQQKIVVSYEGKTSGFYVTVNEAGKTVSSVAIKKLPTKQTYKVGEAFESAGMILKITYTDNTTAEVTSGYTCTPNGKLTTAGQQKIVVSYEGKTSGFYVTVNPAGKTVSGVAIKKLPAKQTYQVGETFDPSGMILKVTYSDNTTAEVTSGYTYTPTGAMNTAGQQTIAVAYKESGVTKGTGFKVTVNDKTVSSITIKKLPSKMTYTVGEKFDPTGMIVKVNYTDGTSREITSGYTYTPTGAMNTAGKQTIAVAYKANGVTKGTGFKVTVNEKTVSSITIKKLPKKMTYTVGEKFDPTGMIVKVNYSDGTSKEITSGYTYTPTGAMNTAGQQTIAVAYKESGVTKGTGFKVTVNG